MTIKDFNSALHNPGVYNWVKRNVDSLILQAKHGGFSKNEDEITDIIVSCMSKPDIQTRQAINGGIADILDIKHKDIGEAAHNETGQPANYGPGHMVKDYFKRLDAGFSKDFYGLMYLSDIENLDTKHIVPDSYIASSRKSAMKKRVKVENLLNLFPGGIQIHKQFHGLKSSLSTVVNYDIYIVKFVFNSANSKDIYKKFEDLNYFKKGEFARLYPTLYKQLTDE